MDFLRRHLLLGLCLVGIAGVTAWVAKVSAVGREMRNNEEDALTVIRAILLAQQDRAQAALASPHEQGEISPYVDLAALLASDNAPPGLGPRASFERVPIEPDIEAFRHQGYLFTVLLLDQHGKRSNVGRRFKALAWPESYGNTGTVFYYTDSYGFVFQGENAAGRYQGKKPPIEEDPILDQSHLKPKDFHNAWRRFESKG
jgi:hypothetical protein